MRRLDDEDIKGEYVDVEDALAWQYSFYQQKYNTIPLQGPNIQIVLYPGHQPHLSRLFNILVLHPSKSRLITQYDTDPPVANLDLANISPP